MSKINVIEGGICAVEGVRAAGSREGKYGLAVIESKDSAASAVFTSNKVVAAPIIHTKEMIKGGKISLVVVNSGNANCFTGQDGIDDCNKTIEFASGITGIPSSEIATASTGVIGRKMPMDIILPLVEESISKLEHSAESSTDASKSIMTTDTYHKEFAVETEIDGEKVRIGGITKGVGMIAPNMGTMLGFITTDLKVPQECLQEALNKSIKKSFNMVVVDGDESTNDTVLLLSTNDVEGEIDDNFQEALDYVCTSLAKQIARDGEGADKFMEVIASGAKTEDDAISLSKSIVSSSLVKTALAGADPNWGRIISAMGYSGVEFDPENVSISIGNRDKDVIIVDKGFVTTYDKPELLEEAENIMKEKTVIIKVDVHDGNYNATAYGCDLTCEYVHINADYTT